MNTEKYLIIIDGEDRTSRIVSYDKEDKYIKVRYNNGIYPCSWKDFEFYKDPVEVKTQESKILLNDGYVFNVKRILLFGRYYKLFFDDDSTRVVRKENLHFVKEQVDQKLNTNKFDYFKEISRIVSIRTEEGASLLTNLYQKINLIPKDTVLYKYLNPDNEIEQNAINLDNLIFPFGTNESQFYAVRNAMKSQVSIIEGPPGTGKTQTILNIIANIVKNNQTVAVVSNNNSATDNVYEKLEKYNLGYLCARLGKLENKEEFIKKQDGKYPKFEKNITNKSILENEITRLNQTINYTLKTQNEIAILKTELSEVDLQYKYFNSDCSNSEINTPKIRNIERITSGQIMKLKVELEEMEEINLFFILKSFLYYGIGDYKFYKKSKEEIIKIFDKMYFIVKQIELNNKIKLRENKLDKDGSHKLALLEKNSNIILKEELKKKYQGRTTRRIFEFTDFNNHPAELNKEYPIVFSTTYSVKKCLNNNYKFDYIIIDESSQVDLITGVLALSVAKNAVIVGDLKQLPNVIPTESRMVVEEATKKYKIDKKYDYLNNCFLESINKVFGNAPKIMLKEHYRCHPRIIQFCNKKFYNDKLVIMTEDNGEKDVIKVYTTTKGNHARGHINQRQIDVIEKEVIPELAQKVPKEEIGIISPYRNQKNKIDSQLESDIQTDTVHKFQGREQDAIIITTVDNEIGEFVDDPRLLNVAVSRAKKFLRLVVSDNENNKGTNIDDLIKYIQYNNFEIIESKTKSIYDMLYKENRKQRMEYLKEEDRISDYDSENLTYKLIDEVLKENGFNNLDIAVHIPLKDILINYDLLDDKEQKYAKNDWTHIDFLIFNKMDKRTVLAIEVDGYYFHKEGTKQQIRDKLKDKILEKYDIPLIRFNTTGSEEKNKLLQKINEILER